MVLFLTTKTTISYHLTRTHCHYLRMHTRSSSHGKARAHFMCIESQTINFLFVAIFSDSIPLQAVGGGQQTQ